MLRMYCNSVFFYQNIHLISLKLCDWIQINNPSLFESMTIAISISLFSPTIWTKFHRYFDRMIYGSKYHPQDIIRKFSLQITNRFELELISELLLKEVIEKLLIKESALFIEAENGFTTMYKDGVALTNQFIEKTEMESLYHNALEYHSPDGVIEEKFDWVRLAVPLRLGAKPIGIWLLGQRNPDDYYSQSDIILLETIANQVAPMLENIRLYKITRDKVEHIQSIREIGVAISSSLDLHLTLDVLLHRVLLQPEVGAASILLNKPINNTLEYVAGKGFLTDDLQHTSMKINEGFAGQAVHERRIVFIPNLEEEIGKIKRSSLFQAEHFISYCAAPLIAKGQVKGVLEVFSRKTINANPEWFNLMESLAMQAAIAIDNASLFNELQRANADLIRAYDTTIEGWSQALELRDEGTEGHTKRVTELTERLAREIGLSESEIVHIRRGVMLHDIGKMGMPDNILLKSSRLTEEEWAIMKQHPVYAFQFLSKIDFLRPAVDIPYCHHEKWDGSGYPRGLRGEEIPQSARVFSIIDVWDALRSNRPYRKAWSDKKAVNYIRSMSGKDFDPAVVKAFCKMIENIY